MKKDPIRNVMTNHIRSRTTSPFSAANTPSWQVTEDSTRTVVLIVENGMFSSSGWVSHSPGLTDRIVKYIANSAAKNISSELSHTMVPTAVVSGRLAGTCVRARCAAAVATSRIIAVPARVGTPDPPIKEFFPAVRSDRAQRTARGTARRVARGAPGPRRAARRGAPADGRPPADRVGAGAAAPARDGARRGALPLRRAPAAGPRRHLGPVAG